MQFDENTNAEKSTDLILALLSECSNDDVMNIQASSIQCNRCYDGLILQSL